MGGQAPNGGQTPPPPAPRRSRPKLHQEPYTSNQKFDATHRALGFLCGAFKEFLVRVNAPRYQVQ